MEARTTNNVFYVMVRTLKVDLDERGNNEFRSSIAVSKSAVFTTSRQTYQSSKHTIDVEILHIGRFTCSFNGLAFYNAIITITGSRFRKRRDSLSTRD